MKQWYSKLKLEFKELFHSKYYLKLFSDITYLSNQGLTTVEIELFLNIKLGDFDDDFFSIYFKVYKDLLPYLNIVQVISYISFTESLKNDTLSKTIKRLSYPIILLLASFSTLYIFKFSLLSVLKDYMSDFMTILINSIFIISFLTLIVILIFLILSIIVFRNPVTTILGYNRLNKLRVFRILEYYYLCIFTNVLSSFYKSGYSTHTTFKLIQRFKSTRIISNLAYFTHSDLEDGNGLEESVKNMNVNKEFQQILLFSLRSNNFESLMTQYQIQLQERIDQEIQFISHALYLVAYVYIGVVVILLYKVISLPLSMISTF